MIQNRTIRLFKSVDKNLIITTCLFFIFILGMIYGVLLCAKNVDNLSAFEFLITDNYIIESDNNSFFYNLIMSFLPAFIFIALPYLLGYSAVFQPLICTVPFVKGLGIGLYMANMYLTYKLKGILFCLIIVLLPTILYVFTSLIACREAIKLSNMFFKSFAYNGEISVKRETIKVYNIKIGILLLIIFFGALLSSILSLLFLRMFNF